MNTIATPHCSANTEHRGHPLTIRRMQGLDTAASILGGKKHLGDVLGITERAAAHKVAGSRGVSDGDLLLTAAALEKLAARITEHAGKLRAEVGR